MSITTTDQAPAPVGLYPHARRVGDLLFLSGVVVFAHHPVVFIGLFMLFLGFTQAYSKYQSPLILKEGLLVGFFLAGLVVLGGMQQWWLQPLVSGLEPLELFFGAVALTAITDNAALTYLGSLIVGLSDEGRVLQYLPDQATLTISDISTLTGDARIVNNKSGLLLNQMEAHIQRID